MLHKIADARNTEAQYLYGAVPSAHDLGWFKTVVELVLRCSVIQAATKLAPDVQQIPNGKSFFAREHCGDAVALYILHRRAELSVDFSSAVHIRDVRAAENLRRFRFGRQSLLQRLGL